MNKIKIALIGASGRMGKSIIAVLSTSVNSKLIAAVERSDNAFLGLDSGLQSGIHQNNIVFTSDLEKSIRESDAVIDFSSHLNVSEVLRYAVAHKKPLVIGVTGIGESVRKEIEQSASSIPIVLSPNMSIGVNLLFKLVEITAMALGDSFDIEILDIHHKHKKDSPSGTTQRIKDILLKSLQRSESDVIYGREGIYEERPLKEIGIHTMRAGEVVGEHSVLYFSPQERLEITHRAEDRKTFAAGAVRAAEFVFNKNPGLYDMFDVLGI